MFVKASTIFIDIVAKFTIQVNGIAKKNVSLLLKHLYRFLSSTPFNRWLSRMYIKASLHWTRCEIDSKNSENHSKIEQIRGVIHTLPRRMGTNRGENQKWNFWYSSCRISIIFHTKQFKISGI